MSHASADQTLDRPKMVGEKTEETRALVAITLAAAEEAIRVVRISKATRAAIITTITTPRKDAGPTAIHPLLASKIV